jgi:hypothetical protein
MKKPAIQVVRIRVRGIIAGMETTSSTEVTPQLHARGSESGGRISRPPLAVIVAPMDVLERSRLYTVSGTSVDVRQGAARCGKLWFAEHLRGSHVVRDVFVTENTHTQVADPNSLCII